MEIACKCSKAVSSDVVKYTRGCLPLQTWRRAEAWEWARWRWTCPAQRFLPHTRTPASHRLVVITTSYHSRINKAVKVIWHKAASPPQTDSSIAYSPGGANVPSHEGTLVPPGAYDWTCAAFGPSDSTTQTANRSVQPFLYSSRQCVVGHARAFSFSVITAPSHGWSGPHLIYASLGPSESTIQTASQSVEPFLHNSPQSVPILYNGPPLFPKMAHFHGGSGPHLVHGQSESSTQTASWLLDWLNHFWRAHYCDRPTDRPRYRSVTIGRITRP